MNSESGEVRRIDPDVFEPRITPPRVSLFSVSSVISVVNKEKEILNHGGHGGHGEGDGRYRLAGTSGFPAVVVSPWWSFVQNKPNSRQPRLLTTLQGRSHGGIRLGTPCVKTKPILVGTAR